MVHEGQIIAGRYRILKEIGRGGTSVVYLVSDNHLNKNFAVKEICKSDFTDSGSIAGNLIEEANIMNKLNHPLLPRIIDVIEQREYVYVVMDYIAGQPLNKVMERYKSIPEQYVIHWFRELCEVLTYLHMSTPPIIFGDLKPSNIILTADGSIRLIDFGAAMEYQRKNSNRKNEHNWGTMGYAAPEQVMNTGKTDARSDIYSLGVTMHFLLTGSDPSNIENNLLPIRKYNPSLSPQLESIIIKCTQISPDDRYRNCRELFADLSTLDKNNGKNKKNHSMTIIASIISIAIFFITMIISIFSFLGSY